MGWLRTESRRFVYDFKTYKVIPHTVAVNPCAAALHLAMIVDGVGRGDEVITDPLKLMAGRKDL